jgi:outer membrane protein assembly factor BamD
MAVKVLILKLLGKKKFTYFCTMFSGRAYIILLVFTALLGFSACSGYEKLLKSTDYRLKYDKAVEYYENEEYARASGLLEQCVNVFRGTTKADTVFYYHARCYLAMRDYTVAGYTFKGLAENYPSSAFAEEADFMTAFCNYKLSPRPELDQENTNKAITAFQLFLIKSPGSDRRKEAAQYIAELRNKLIQKSYLSGKLYYDLGEYRASIIALENSLEEYPDTEHREELMFLLLKSNFLLAENSVPAKQAERYQNTVDEYYSFVGEFGESSFRKEADRMYQDALGRIGGSELVSEE